MSTCRVPIPHLGSMVAFGRAIDIGRICAEAVDAAKCRCDVSSRVRVGVGANFFQSTANIAGGRWNWVGEVFAHVCTYEASLMKAIL